MKPVEPSRQVVVEVLAGPDLDVLTRLTVAGTFDERAWTALGGAAERYAALAANPMVEPVGGGYRLRDAFHRLLYPRLEPAERAEVARTLAGQPLDPHEAALQGMVLEPAAAPDLLRERMREPLERWDLGAAERWLAVADAALARIEPTAAAGLRRARAELGAAAAARALWRTTRLRLYVEQAATVDLWDHLRDGPAWALQLHAPGGSGKTTFLRWLISHRCVPSDVPVALVDFDRTEWVERLVSGPAELLRPVLEQLDAQLPDRPLRTLTAGAGPLEPALVGRALASALGGRHALVICDTTERLLLAHRVQVLALWDLLAAVRAAAPTLRGILAGRHDLLGRRPDGRPEVPGLAERAGDALLTRVLAGFTRDEATRYLRDVRKVPAAEVDRLVRIAVGADGTANPLKLSLLAQMALVGGLGDDVESWAQVQVQYLVQRVIEWIPSPVLRWVVRWGVLADPLTKAFHHEVLWPLLVEEQQAARDRRRDQPDADPAQQGVFLDAAPVDAEATWSTLVDYVTGTSWVRPVQDAPDAVEFHPDVRDPMRRLLADQPIVAVIHERARAWFAARGDPAGAVYHAIELGPEVARAEAARAWGTVPGTREDVARVIVEARERGRALEDGLVARAWAELAAGALRGGDVVVAREHARELARWPHDELPPGTVDWLLGAVDGDDDRLAAAARSPEAGVAASANAILGERRLDAGRLDALPPLRAAHAVAGEDREAHRRRLVEALVRLERHGEALLLATPAEVEEIRAAAGLLSRSDRFPLRTVGAALALGFVDLALARAESATDRGRALGAALLVDEAVTRLDRAPLDAARILLDSGLEVRERVARLARAVERTDPVEAAVLRARARITERRPSAAAVGPTAAVRLALAALIGGGEARPLAEALANVELPERRLVLLEGLLDAPAPDTAALVPLVEHAGVDGATALRLHQALIFGWGGRREEAERLVRDGLRSTRRPAVVRGLARAHRALGLAAEALSVDALDGSGLPPESPLVGVAWLEIAEALAAAGDLGRAHDAVERSRAHLPEGSPWAARLEQVLGAHAVGSAAEAGSGEDPTVRVHVAHDAGGWTARGSDGTDLEAPDDPLLPDEIPPVDLGYALAEDRGRVIEALGRVVKAAAARIDLVAAAGAALPWELALRGSVVFRAGGPGAARRGGRRVLRVAGTPARPWVQSTAPRASLDRAYAEHGFEVLDAPPDVEALLERLAHYPADVLHVAGTFVTEGERVLLAGGALSGETLGRVARGAVVIVDADTAGLPDGERWHQLLLRNQLCGDAARVAAVVLGVGAVPDPLRAAHDQALVAGLREARTVGELAARLRGAADDDAFRAVVVHAVDPDLPWEAT